MKYAWDALIKVLPIQIRKHMDKFLEDKLEEIRMRLHLPLIIISGNKEYFLDHIVTSDDLTFCINTASQYSPWSVQTIPQGYITIEGGHRIGIAGNMIYKDNIPCGINSVYSVCIRVANEIPNVSRNLWKLNGSILIIGKPGSGKTTLLRDLIYQKSNKCDGSVCVIDEKKELFPFIKGIPCYSSGKRTDIISGSKKIYGIEIALRNMGPSLIAVDEITAPDDCDALTKAGWCGVSLIASAHAGSRQDLFTRSVYKPIIETKLFDTLVILNGDKSWRVERMYE